MSKPLAPPQGKYAATVLGSISLEFAFGPGTDESLRAEGEIDEEEASCSAR